MCTPLSIRRSVSPHLFLFTFGVFFFSCANPERSNPLESNSEDLFIPQILEPSGGEQWFPGMERSIRWIPATHIQDTVVTIQLLCGDLAPQIIARDAPNTGQYLWVVPNAPSPACKVRIIGSAGHSESDTPFRINPDPDLRPLGIEGREPAALRERVLFTSDSGGNDDVWLFNRLTESLNRLTDHPEFDGQADWFKPNGNVLAYTSTQSGQNDIWMMSLTELQPVRITTGGGEQPAWQPSFFSFPSLAYIRFDGLFTHIFSVTIDVPTPIIVPLPDSVGVSLPLQLTSIAAGLSSITDIRSLDWASPGGDNAILYETPSLMWRIDLTQAFNADVRLFVINPKLFPTHPAFSISGALVAFSADGDLWMKPVSGGEEIQLTYGAAEDDLPDWATETEIVFQRRETPEDPWTLWTLQVPP